MVNGAPVGVGAGAEPSAIELSAIDLGDASFWDRPWAEREAAFAVLRRERPVAFFEEPEIAPFPRGPGFHAVTRHADVVAVSKAPEVFSSAAGAVSILDMPPEMNEFYGSMISMDDPRHARLRRIVSGTFTPRMLDRVLDDVATTAREVVERVRGAGEIDFVRRGVEPVPAHRGVRPDGHPRRASGRWSWPSRT